MRSVCWIGVFLLPGLHDISSSQMTPETVERARRPGYSQNVSASTEGLRRAVNGSAIVRNRCRAQGKDIEIEETAEVIERDGCKLVVRVRKVTRAAHSQAAGDPAAGKKSSSNRQPTDGQEQSGDRQQEIEFMVYADLSELTTPVLIEKQRFGQCQAGGDGVVKVTGRSEPGKAVQVIRKSPTNGAATEDKGVKQKRRDLSLFFSVPAAAEKARKALERAVESCGGKEWPDEDDLP